MQLSIINIKLYKTVLFGPFGLGELVWIKLSGPGYIGS